MPVPRHLSSSSKGPLMTLWCHLDSSTPLGMPSLKSAGMSSVPAVSPSAILFYTSECQPYQLHTWLTVMFYALVFQCSYHVKCTTAPSTWLQQDHDHVSVAHAAHMQYYFSIFKDLFDTLEDAIILSTKLQPSAQNDQIHKTETDHCHVCKGSFQFLLHLFPHFHDARVHHGDPLVWNIKCTNLTCDQMIHSVSNSQLCIIIKGWVKTTRYQQYYNVNLYNTHFLAFMVSCFQH